MKSYSDIARSGNLIGRNHEKAQLQKFLEEKSAIILVSGERDVEKMSLLYSIYDLLLNQVYRASIRDLSFPIEMNYQMDRWRDMLQAFRRKVIYSHLLEAKNA